MRKVSSAAAGKAKRATTGAVTTMTSAAGSKRTPDAIRRSMVGYCSVRNMCLGESKVTSLVALVS